MVVGGICFASTFVDVVGWEGTRYVISDHLVIQKKAEEMMAVEWIDGAHIAPPTDPTVKSLSILL